jgi:sugar-specific transcriptional regulator TrmB
LEDIVTIEAIQLEETLEQLGLTKTEAKVYLCLLDQSPLPAAAIADLVGTSRNSVYLVLRSLVAKGLIDAGAGCSSRYHAAPPHRALTGLIERNKAELAARERHVVQALPELTELEFGASTTAMSLPSRPSSATWARGRPAASKPGSTRASCR